MLKLDRVVINYKKRNILSDVCMEINKGEVVGLLGANGSGKSTLLSVIAGAKKVESGELSIYDISLSQKIDEYRKHIGFVPQENPLIAELSSLDNLRIWSELGKDELLELISSPPLSILGVYEFADKKVNDLSGGMKKRLSITATLMRNPELLLMDEPFAALDMVAKHDIMEYIRTYKASGGTTIIASHDEMVLSCCDRIFFIENGKVTELNKNSGVRFIDLLRGTGNAR